MDLMDRPASGSEEPGPQAGRDKLAEHIARAVREDGTVEPLEGLHLARASSPTGSVHVAGAGYRVGYSDASQFTREYKRLFGAPPMRDVVQLREAAMEGVGA
jgi:AraC-like DNA-binding protein